MFYSNHFLFHCKSFLQINKINYLKFLSRMAAFLVQWSIKYFIENSWINFVLFFLILIFSWSFRLSLSNQSEFAYVYMYIYCCICIHTHLHYKKKRKKEEEKENEIVVYLFHWDTNSRIYHFHKRLFVTSHTQ